MSRRWKRKENFRLRTDDREWWKSYAVCCFPWLSQDVCCCISSILTAHVPYLCLRESRKWCHVTSMTIATSYFLIFPTLQGRSTSQMFSGLLCLCTCVYLGTLNCSLFLTCPCLIDLVKCKWMLGDALWFTQETIILPCTYLSFGEMSRWDVFVHLSLHKCLLVLDCVPDMW